MRFTEKSKLQEKIRLELWLDLPVEGNKEIYHAIQEHFEQVLKKASAITDQNTFDIRDRK